MLRNEDIYAAIFDDDAFLALPDRFAKSVDGRSGLINWIHSDGEHSNFAYSYFSKQFIEQYTNNYIDKDPWTASSISDSRYNTLYNASFVVGDKYWERSDIYNNLVRASGDDTFYCIGGSFRTKWGVGIIGINRGKSAGNFDDESLPKLNDSAVALRQTLMVRGEIAAQRRSADTAKSMLDIVGVAAICVSRDLRVIHANESAEAALRRADGLYVKLGMLHARNELAARQLGKAAQDATAPFQPTTAAFSVPRIGHDTDPPGSPYQVTVTPLPTISGAARALIVFRDPDAAEPTLVERVRALFRLTLAEAELAVALSEGLTLADIAVRRAVRESTVRSQVKGLAAKMACNRQTEIAIAVAKLAPLRIAPQK